MNILILNRSRLAIRPYREWMGHGHRLVLLTDSAALSADPATRRGEVSSFDEMFAFDAYHDNTEVERKAIELHSRDPFDQIVAMAEFDLLRASRLREYLGVPGQGTASSEAFRDKYVMKSRLQEAGVPLAPFALAADPTGVLRFVEKHGLPVVVKPRRGGGSMGVTVVRTEDELWECLAGTAGMGGDDGAACLVESYLEHELHHVDGLVVDGKPWLLWPSSQGTTSCLGMMAGQVLRSSLLDPSDPRVPALRRMTLAALEALPTPGTCIVHAEVFETADGFVFNEIACRMAGGRIEEEIELGFDVSLPEAYVRAVTQAPLPAPPQKPLRSAGLALFPATPGRVVAVPGACELHGLRGYVVNAAVGTELSGPRTSVDAVVSTLAVGESRAEVEATLDAVTTWVQAGLVMAPTAPTGEPAAAPS